MLIYLKVVRILGTIANAIAAGVSFNNGSPIMGLLHLALCGYLISRDPDAIVAEQKIYERQNKNYLDRNKKDEE